MGMLSDAAAAELQKLTVRTRIELPYGPTWQPGEYGFVVASVTNTTTARLNNLVLKLRIATIWGDPPVRFVPSGSWDGNGATVSSLAPGETVDLIAAFLYAIHTGWFDWKSLVSADVIALGSSGNYSGGWAAIYQ